MLSHVDTLLIYKEKSKTLLFIFSFYGVTRDDEDSHIIRSMCNVLKAIEINVEPTLWNGKLNPFLISISTE